MSYCEFGGLALDRQIKLYQLIVFNVLDTCMQDATN